VPINPVTHPVDEAQQPHPKARLRWRRFHLDRAGNKPNRTDALKIKVARKVVSTRPQRRQWRIKPRF
jgi:hypothetical protein